MTQPTILGTTIRKIPVDQTMGLRHAVLWPDKPIAYVRLPEDDSGHHYGAFLSQTDSTPAAVISVFIESLPALNGPDLDELVTVPAARFRKFACDPSYQNQGIGTGLLQHVFEAANSELGCGVIWCDARLATKGWYERRGMRTFGGTFFKGEVEYVRMLRGL